MGATAATHSDMLIDGLNEKGLNVGLFYFPGYAQYTPAAQARSGRILAPAQITAWILGNFATTEEVKAQIGSIDLTPQVMDLIGIVPDMHIKVQDAAGRSIVIEPRGGRLVVHDNPTRVLTNAPTFDWHLTNLNNYVTLMQAYPTPKIIGAPGAGQITLKPFGMGGAVPACPGISHPPRALCAWCISPRGRRNQPTRIRRHSTCSTSSTTSTSPTASPNHPKEHPKPTPTSPPGPACLT